MGFAQEMKDFNNSLESVSKFWDARSQSKLNDAKARQYVVTENDMNGQPGGGFTGGGTGLDDAPAGGVAEPNNIFDGFMGEVKKGITNPYGLAVVASTGKHESGYSPGNAGGEWDDGKYNAGGVLSWNGPRLDRLKAAYGGKMPSPEEQGKYFLNEQWPGAGKDLVDKLNSATSIEEAQAAMNKAWGFEGHDNPNSPEVASRLADSKAYYKKYGGEWSNLVHTSPTSVAGSPTAGDTTASSQPAIPATGGASTEDDGDGKDKEDAADAGQEDTQNVQPQPVQTAKVAPPSVPVPNQPGAIPSMPVGSNQFASVQGSGFSNPAPQGAQPAQQSQSPQMAAQQPRGMNTGAGTSRVAEALLTTPEERLRLQQLQSGALFADKGGVIPENLGVPTIQQYYAGGGRVQSTSEWLHEHLPAWLGGDDTQPTPQDVSERSDREAGAKRNSEATIAHRMGPPGGRRPEQGPPDDPRKSQPEIYNRTQREINSAVADMHKDKGARDEAPTPHRPPQVEPPRPGLGGMSTDKPLVYPAPATPEDDYDPLQAWGTVMSDMPVSRTPSRFVEGGQEVTPAIPERGQKEDYAPDEGPNQLQDYQSVADAESRQRKPAPPSRGQKEDYAPDEGPNQLQDYQSVADAESRQRKPAPPSRGQKEDYTGPDEEVRPNQLQDYQSVADAESRQRKGIPSRGQKEDYTPPEPTSNALTYERKQKDDVITPSQQPPAPVPSGSARAAATPDTLAPGPAIPPEPTSNALTYERKQKDDVITPSQQPPAPVPSGSARAAATPDTLAPGRPIIPERGQKEDYTPDEEEVRPNQLEEYQSVADAESRQRKGTPNIGESRTAEPYKPGDDDYYKDDPWIQWVRKKLRVGPGVVAAKEQQGPPMPKGGIPVPGETPEKPAAAPAVAPKKAPEKLPSGRHAPAAAAAPRHAVPRQQQPYPAAPAQRGQPGPEWGQRSTPSPSAMNQQRPPTVAEWMRGDYRDSQYSRAPAPHTNPRTVAVAAVGAHNGMQWLTDAFGFRGRGAIADPSEASSRQVGARRFMDGFGAATTRDNQIIDRAAGIDPSLPDGIRHVERLSKLTQVYQSRGMGKEAKAAAASQLQYGSNQVAKLGALAKASYTDYLQTGNPAALTHTLDFLREAHSYIPSGESFGFYIDPATRKFMITSVDADGQTQNHQITEAELPGIIMSTMNKSAYWSGVESIADPAAATARANREHSDMARHEGYQHAEELQRKNWGHQDEVDARKTKVREAETAAKHDQKVADEEKDQLAMEQVTPIVKKVKAAKKALDADAENPELQRNYNILASELQDAVPRGMKDRLLFMEGADAAVGDFDYVKPDDRSASVEAPAQSSAWWNPFDWGAMTPPKGSTTSTPSAPTSVGTANAASAKAPPRPAGVSPAAKYDAGSGNWWQPGPDGKMVVVR